MEKMMFSSDEITNSIKTTVADGGSFPLVVTGTSMQPFLEDGRDVVWLGECKKQDISKGVILLFEREDGSLILHRVRQVLPDGRIEMNGDALSWSEQISFGNVIATVTHIEKNGKRISCSSPFYKSVISLWQAALPFRYYILKLWKMFR